MKRIYDMAEHVLTASFYLLFLGEGLAGMFFGFWILLSGRGEIIDPANRTREIWACVAMIVSGTLMVHFAMQSYRRFVERRKQGD